MICRPIAGRRRFGEKSTRHGSSIGVSGTSCCAYVTARDLHFFTRASRRVFPSEGFTARTNQSNAQAPGVCTPAEAPDHAEEQTTDEITTGCAPFSFIRDEQPERRRSVGRSMLGEASFAEDAGAAAAAGSRRERAAPSTAHKPQLHCRNERVSRNVRRSDVGRRTRLDHGEGTRNTRGAPRESGQPVQQTPLFPFTRSPTKTLTSPRLETPRGISWHGDTRGRRGDRVRAL